MASSPHIEGDRLWLRTNRSEVICLDIGPVRLGKGEARLHWKTDLVKEFGVFPRHPAMAMGPTPGIGTPYKDLIHVVTSNGVDESYEKIKAPDAPSLVCLHRDTGKLIWKDSSPGKNIMIGQYSTPLLAEVNGRAQVIVPLGDGWLYSFEPETGKHLWKCY